MKNTDYQLHICNWLSSIKISTPYAITLHMKTSNTLAAQKHIGFFRNRYERGIKRRYQRYIFIPIIEHTPHLHYHIITERPPEQNHAYYIKIVENAMLKTKQLENNYNIVKPAYDVKGWTRYITKLKHPEDDIDIINLRR